MPQPSFPSCIVVFRRCLPAGARAADSLAVTFDLADLPSTITLCRDPTAAAAFAVDEQWNIGIDVDNDINTGLPGLGVDVSSAR